MFSDDEEAQRLSVHLQRTSLPHLPPDVERIIFTIAADLHWKRIPILMRIAWRVKEWLEPILYRVAFISDDDYKYKFLAAFCVVPTTVFLLKITPPLPSPVSHIRHILWNPAESADAIFALVLSACPLVEDLFFDDEHITDYFPTLNQMHCLHRLAMYPQWLSSSNPCDFQIPQFLRTITHLKLLGGKDTSSLSNLAANVNSLPNLTHVAFNVADNAIEKMHSYSRVNTRLECIIFFINEDRTTGLGSDDERFVCVRQVDFRREWLVEATGRVGYWTRADEFIARKRAGTLDRTSYLIPDHSPLETPSDSSVQRRVLRAAPAPPNKNIVFS
ncbi:hypothetical protein R3P38DRAFT_2857407 [Favolaschia claudopus]|uniref:Uncharacterized protein n=1 Tax=Favolaschia claudopus TaxID=2862362 RepID=A0AAW0DIL7_9AGAR